MSTLNKSLFCELKRRNVFKIGAAYLVFAWVLIQVTLATVPALGIPEWVNTVVFYFSIIGFPIALFFAWAFEVTPDGIKKEADISPEESITAHKGRKLNVVVIGALVLIAGYFIYESRFLSDNEQKIVIQSPSPETKSLDSITPK